MNKQYQVVVKNSADNSFIAEYERSDAEWNARITKLEQRMGR